VLYLPVTQPGPYDLNCSFAIFGRYFRSSFPSVALTYIFYQLRCSPPPSSYPYFPGDCLLPSLRKGLYGEWLELWGYYMSRALLESKLISLLFQGSSLTICGSQRSINEAPSDGAVVPNPHRQGTTNKDSPLHLSSGALTAPIQRVLESRQLDFLMTCASSILTLNITIGGSRDRQVLKSTDQIVLARYNSLSRC
jgi:hypothetical protein